MTDDATDAPEAPAAGATLDDIAELLRRIDERQAKAETYKVEHLTRPAMTEGDFRHRAASRLAWILAILVFWSVVNIAASIYAYNVVSDWAEQVGLHDESEDDSAGEDVDDVELDDEELDTEHSPEYEACIDDVNKTWDECQELRDD